MSMVNEEAAEDVTASRLPGSPRWWRDLEQYATEVASRAQVIDRTNTFDADLYERAVGLGYLRLMFDASGALDLDRMPLVHEVTERISAGSASVALQLSGTRLVAYLLERYAERTVRDAWLAPLLRGEIFGSFAITEPHAGTDVRAISTVAHTSADGYVLTGTKCWIGYAPIASVAVVLAKLDSDARNAPTVALVVDLGGRGVSREPGPELSGFRGMPNGVLTFDGVHVPRQAALTTDGFLGMMDGLNLARIEAASYACGLLRGSLEQATQRARERSAFGKPLGDLPSIQAKLGRALAGYHTARTLTLTASRSFAGRHGGDQDLISIAKMTASDLAREHTDQMMQVFGASGLAESAVERMHRDAKVTQIFDGTSEIHELMLGRRLVRSYGERGPGAPYFPEQGSLEPSN